MIRRTLDVAGLTKFLKTCKSFDGVLQKVQIISVGNGKCLAELKIENEHTNPMGGLHGGFSATLVDNISGYALLSTLDDAKMRTVSVNIQLSYLKGAKINDTVVIDTKLVKCGKQLACMEAEIRNKENGDILVKGTHSRFLLRKN